MKVENHHHRRISRPLEAVGECLDTLGTRGDRLWPHERWPRMILDKPLELGAKGGHGPIRYVVEEYEAGRQVVFRFTEPAGFLGTHRFVIQEDEGGCRLLHSIEMRLSGSALLTWPLVFRPLHDALLEDALDKVEGTLCGDGWTHRSWSPGIRFLRRVLARRRRKNL